MRPPSALVGPQSPLRALRAQRRLVSERLRVLVPVDGYYAQGECIRALRQLGHEVFEVVLGTRGDAGPTPEVLQNLLQAVVLHRPDMMLVINFTGFDRANYLTELLEAMGLPTALWFVDNPLVLAMGWMPPAPTCASYFVWDRTFVPALRALGAERTFHLPLGTDPELFCPGPISSNGRQALGFVGHSLVILEQLWLTRLSADEVAQAQQMAQALSADRSILHALVPDPQSPIDRKTMVLAMACVLSSKDYRLGLLEHLPQENLHVTGDAHWAELLPRAHHHPSTDYGAQSAQLYRDTTLSINATNLQMPATVNQRVFDVPACAGFLITDNQAELADYFDLGHGRDMVAFASAEELRDQVQYYSARPQQRQAMAKRARARVLAEHTYRHRIQTLLQIMRREHASVQHGALPAVARGEAPQPAP